MTEIISNNFGAVNGIENKLFTLSNGKMKVSIMNYGATIVSIKLLMKFKWDWCVYDTVEDYQNRGGYLAAIIGRSSNRISNAQFILNGNKYKLYANEKTNNLHVGKVGFDKKIWKITPNNLKYKHLGNSILTKNHTYNYKTIYKFLIVK